MRKMRKGGSGGVIVFRMPSMITNSHFVLGMQRHGKAVTKGPHGPAQKKNRGQAIKGRFVIVDGLHLIRMRGRNNPQLEVLLTLIRMVAADAADFMCFFDANTFYELRDHQDLTRARAYEHLLASYGRFFIEVASGTRADDILLPEAHKRRAIVISNDSFSNYDYHYPWICDKTRVLRVNAAREYIHFDGHRMATDNDLGDLIADLNVKMLRRQQQMQAVASRPFN